MTVEISEVVVPLVLKTGFEPVGEMVAAHVYVRFPAPPISVATTLSSVFVPVTGLGVAAAGSKIVGGESLTTTEAVPLVKRPVVARTVALPEESGAV